MQGGLGIVSKGKEVILFYQLLNKKDRSIFMVKSKDGRSFASAPKKITIASKSGSKEVIKNCSDFYFSQRGDEYVLRYVLAIRKKKYYCEAVSKTLSSWKVKQKSEVQLEKSAIVAGFTYKGQAVRYGGKSSIYLGFQRKLKKSAVWENAPVPVLEPRMGHFDHTAMEVAGAYAVKEGILLAYVNKYLRRDHAAFTVGVAIIDKKDPHKILWRSPLPIWEQPEEWDDKKTHFIGSVLFNHNIIFYWGNKKGQIFSVAWPFKDYLAAILAGKYTPALCRHSSNPILSPNTKSWWESKAVMNAAAINLEGRTHLLYRAIGDTDVSMIGYASSVDGFCFDEKSKDPVYTPRESFEGVGDKPAVIDPRLVNPTFISGGGGAGGCEDPRLTKIDDDIYMTYVAFNGYSAPGVAMSSIKESDFINKNWAWKKPRLISVPGKIEKNWVIFPEKVHGRYAILHSIAPKIAIEYVNNLEDENLQIVSFRYNNGVEKRWDNMMRGVGAPPIKTDYGWLLFYHAMDRNDPNRYKVGAMILDYENPEKIICRSTSPVLEPNEKYENEGYKWGVVYVCGTVVKDGVLFVYYGGADKVMCVATAQLDSFVQSLVKGEDFRIREYQEVKIIK